jgi:hypothetical protein
MRRALIVVAIAAMPSLAFAQQTTSQQMRADAAQRVVNVITAQYSAGQSTLDEVAAWNKRLFEAKRDTGLTGAALVAAAQAWVDKMKALEQLARARVQTGVASSAEADKALFYRLDAEITLAKLKSP